MEKRGNQINNNNSIRLNSTIHFIFEFAFKNFATGSKFRHVTKSGRRAGLLFEVEMRLLFTLASSIKLQPFARNRVAFHTIRIS